jgi:hypothetical protein
MLTSSFEYGILKIYKDGRQIVEQPFNPTHNGNQDPWIDEKEAIDWFIGSMIDIVSTPDEKSDFIKALNLGE